MSLLITGCAGFIGYNFTKKILRSKKIVVYGIDDFSNNNIYCASSGGNIWKGTIDGENWESLTDYMQILGITFLRIINTDSGQRILIGSENNGFYYSDNECLTLTETNGLGDNYVKRFVMQSGTNHIYALVNDSPRTIYHTTD